MLTDLLKSRSIVLDIETTSESGKKEDNVDPWKNNIICIAIEDTDTGVQYGMLEPEMRKNKKLIKQIIESPDIKKSAANGKFDFKTLQLKGYGMVQNFYFDTQIAGKTLCSTGANNNKNFSLTALYEKYVGKADWKFDYDAEHTPEEWLELCVEDVKRTTELCKKLYDLLHYESLLDPFWLKMSVLEKTIDMELRGIPVDREQAEAVLTKYSRWRDKVQHRADNFLDRNNVDELIIKKTNKKGERTVKTINREGINIGSPDQLPVILYDILKYPEKKKWDSKTRKQKRTTDKNALAELASEGCEFARWVLYLRYWTKLTEFAQKIVDNIGEDGRIHGEFEVYGAETGRWASRNPNLQQIPSKTAASAALRKAITGKYPLIVADLSNVELRILAALSEDENLMRVYQEDRDVHLDLIDTLKEQFGLDLKKSQAKNLNFGISYGGQKWGIAKQMNIKKDQPWMAVKDRVSLDEAQEMIDGWYAARPMVRYWQESITDVASQVGFSSSVYGRRRYLDYSALNKHSKRDEFKIVALDRKAVNHTIQATAGEIIDMAIHALKDENIILMVHDEIVIENPKRSLEEIQEIMENVVDLGIKMKVGIKQVSNWEEGK